jgi:hypothetical protein
MPVISIATNEDSVFIHIDKKVCEVHQLSQLLEFVQLNFADFSHIPEVSDEEQQELSTWLDTIPASERETVFSRVVEL